MLRGVLNYDHLDALREALDRCKHRLLIATADVKNLRVPPASSRGRSWKAPSILRIFEDLAENHVEVRLLHSGVPSGAFIEELKTHRPATLTMRRCPRMHAKILIADGRWMYMGSANLTGAGLGAKSPTRRNFEAGIFTDDLTLIDPVADMLDDIWCGARCRDCGRKAHCPVPLEEPNL